MILFHGGCHGCTKQDTVGIDNCVKCCYFQADWRLPDLSNKMYEGDVVRMKLKEKHSLPFTDREEYLLSELGIRKADLIEPTEPKGIVNYIRGLWT